ncbi:hypothetical protein GCM10010191_82740 [Actinomadura vinacea]|uniref:Uncharacterized protein n=1 Tax=Actinomadura vinacea TaxID=115336 RepID=A0ABP5XC63_9ACTN
MPDLPPFGLQHEAAGQHGDDGDDQGAGENPERHPSPGGRPGSVPGPPSAADHDRTASLLFHPLP